LALFANDFEANLFIMKLICFDYSSLQLEVIMYFSY